MGSPYLVSYTSSPLPVTRGVGISVFRKHCQVESRISLQAAGHTGFSGLRHKVQLLFSSISSNIPVSIKSNSRVRLPYFPFPLPPPLQDITLWDDELHRSRAMIRDRWVALCRLSHDRHSPIKKTVKHVLTRLRCISSKVLYTIALLHHMLVHIIRVP